MHNNCFAIISTNTIACSTIPISRVSTGCIVICSTFRSAEMKYVLSLEQIYENHKKSCLFSFLIWYHATWTLSVAIRRTLLPAPHVADSIESKIRVIRVWVRGDSITNSAVKAPPSFGFKVSARISVRLQLSRIGRIIRHIRVTVLFAFVVVDIRRSVWPIICWACVSHVDGTLRIVCGQVV